MGAWKACASECVWVWVCNGNVLEEEEIKISAIQNMSDDDI